MKGGERGTGVDRVLFWVRASAAVLIVGLFLVASPTLDLLGSDGVHPTGIGGVLCYVAALVMCRWPRAGVWAALVPMAWALVFGPSGHETVALAASSVAVVAVGRLIVLAVTVAVHLAWILVIRLIWHPPPSIYTIWGVALPAMWALGLILRYFVEAIRRDDATIEALVEESERIHDEERTALAHELHDVVTSQLSVISLQLMAHGGSGDAPALRGALHTVGDAARAALAELRILVSVLRDDGESDAAAPARRPVRAPSELADDLADRLVRDGFVVDLAVDPAIDSVEESTRRTTDRLLEVCVANIGSHAKPGSPCRLRLDVEESEVAIEVGSVLRTLWRPLRDPLRGGRGLRALRERIQLTNGELTAAAEGDEWVVRARIERPL